MTGPPVVHVRGLSKTWATAAGGSVDALRDVDLDVAQGEFVSLIGPSGCGKSTLLRAIADLVRPTAGQILVNGTSPERARLDHDYGMVFQAPVLFDWRTVEENIRLPLEILGRPKAWSLERARTMLDLVELEAFARHRPYELSGGMQQRVSIARALSFEPRLLLMDEPFGALDEMTRDRLNDALLRIREHTGITVMFVTHSIPEAVYLSSRVMVMSTRPGRIATTITIDLPRPRTDPVRESARYFELVTEVREALRAVEPAAGG